MSIILLKEIVETYQSVTHNAVYKIEILDKLLNRIKVLGHVFRQMFHSLFFFPQSSFFQFIP